MKNPLVERPWLLVVVGLGVFVLVWTVFILIAVTHPTESVPLVVPNAVAK